MGFSKTQVDELSDLMILSQHGLSGWAKLLSKLIDQYKKPVPHCPTCRGPVEKTGWTTEEERDIEEIPPEMMTKDDPEPEIETYTAHWKGAVCEFCGWQSERVEVEDGK